MTQTRAVLPSFLLRAFGLWGSTVHMTVKIHVLCFPSAYLVFTVPLVLECAPGAKVHRTGLCLVTQSYIQEILNPRSKIPTAAATTY